MQDKSKLLVTLLNDCEPGNLATAVFEAVAKVAVYTRRLSSSPFVSLLVASRFYYSSVRLAT